MDPGTLKKLRNLVILSILLFLGLSNLDVVLKFVNKMLSVISPFLIGALIAFIINAPMNFLERQYLKYVKNPKLLAWARPVCLLLAMIFIFGIFSMVAIVLVPRLVEAVRVVVNLLPNGIAEVSRMLRGIPQAQEVVDSIYQRFIQLNPTEIGQHILNFLQKGSGTLAGSTFGFIGNIFGSLLNFVLGLFFAIYLLAGKEKLQRQATQILYAFVPEAQADYLLHVAKLCYRTFYNFFIGECIEVVVQGVLVIVAMTVLRFPYAIVIGIITGFFAFIPIFGAFISAVIGFLLILTVDVRQAFLFLIFILVLQQIDGNFIYPRIVGSNVGLPALWTLVAVTLGTSLFGIVGMILFVPFVSAIYQLMREQTMARLVEKQVDVMKKRELID